MSTILLVQSEEDQILAMRRALAHARVANPLRVITSGQQALDYLSGVGAHKDRKVYPLPSIIFLDLSLPNESGFEVLKWLRNQPPLQWIVVIALTSPSETKDQDRAYALGARTYLVKPPTSERLRAIMGLVDNFWIGKNGASPTTIDGTKFKAYQTRNGLYVTTKRKSGR